MVLTILLESAYRAELAQTAAVFGDDWQPYGLEPNLAMLRDFCQRQYEQQLVAKPVDPEAAFAAYTRITQGMPEVAPNTA